MKKAGYKRIAHPFLETLDSRLKDVGVATFPDLVDPTNTHDTWIYLFDLDHPVPGVQPARVLFSDEEQLSRFLMLNFPVLSYIKRAGLHFRGREVRIADNCIIDLLAEDKKSHELVGFELKTQQADDRLLTQVEKYTTALSRQAKKEGKPGARLLIVTGQPDQHLQSAVQDLANLRGVKTQWLLYSVQLDLTEVP